MPNWPRRRYSLGVRTSSGTTATAALEIIAASSGGSGMQAIGPFTYLMELRVCMAAATASIFGIGRPAAIGVTPTTPVFLLNEQATGSSANTSTALAWGTGPTIPAAFFRRVDLPATVGVEQVFIFQNGLYIPPGTSIVLWNAASNGVADVNLVVEESI
jgi:hypothetical protein